MPAYLVSVVEVTNPTPGFRQYAQKSAELLKQFGGRYLVRGKPAEILSGDLYQKKTVIVAEFADITKLHAFYHSDAYQKDCKPLREGSGIYDIGIFESPPADKP
jgi:uncharacterized protein (DUF1330 family)